MSKRIRLSILAVLASLLLAIPVAHAQEPTPPEMRLPRAQRGRFLGQVASTGANSFELHTRRGLDLTVRVDGQTTYHDIQGNPKSFSDISAGTEVGVATERRGEALFARRVVILPECAGTPGDPCLYKGVGEVTSVDSDSFEFTGRRGRQWTFEVDASTRFRSRDGSLDGIEDLKPGMKVFVAAWEHEDGDWYALVVTGPLPPRPLARPGARPSVP